ncbi:MAG: hypothetical protein OFPI_05430 [Osedax symbiont Rs2]|nr:MAG: hypothetical protein OFPI_05430 [Osedax symbiont Rs2]
MNTQHYAQYFFKSKHIYLIEQLYLRSQLYSVDFQFQANGCNCPSTGLTV